MDRNRIVLVNLSKGKVGGDSARLLGSILVSSLQAAALSRADTAEKRRNFYLLVIDEFQSFTTTSFVDLLSEIRKYGIALVLAHQYLAQLRPEIRDAVIGNVGSHLVFRVGGEDGNVFHQDFGREWPPERFADQPAFRAVGRVTNSNDLQAPRSLDTLAPTRWMSAHAERIRRSSVARFSEPLSVINDRVNRWLERRF